MDRLLKMVDELESTPFSMGSNSTQIWLREFNNYRQYFATEPDDQQGFYDTLKAFLKISFNKQWSSFIHWRPNPNRVRLYFGVYILDFTTKKFLNKLKIKINFERLNSLNFLSLRISPKAVPKNYFNDT